ncbi:hypothetical protein [Salinisphaera sp.]
MHHTFFDGPAHPAGWVAECGIAIPIDTIDMPTELTGVSACDLA